jgi:hypothetical protein
MDMTEHFAIVPLGKLESGRYEVVMKQVPLDEDSPFRHFPPVTIDWERRIISRPFSFTVDGTARD